MSNAIQLPGEEESHIVAAVKAGKRYNVPVEDLRNALERERQAGRISAATYRGTLGQAAGQELPGVEGLERSARSEPGRPPEPERPEALDHSLPGEPFGYARDWIDAALGENPRLHLGRISDTVRQDLVNCVHNTPLLPERKKRQILDALDR